MDPFVPVHPLDEDAPPSIVINPHSALGKELRKWEQHRTDLVPRGTEPGNPYVYRPYPRMLYKAQRQQNGQYACMMEAPHPFSYSRAEDHDRAVQIREAFDKSCQRIVSDESAERVAKGQGWCGSPQEALEAAERAEQAAGNASAEALFQAQRMSQKAKRELADAEEATHAHVVDVVGRKKPGRKPKVIAPSDLEVAE